MTTKAEWAAQHGIEIATEKAARNPNMADEKWAREADHWKVTLKRAAKRMTLYYSKGSGHHGAAPQIGEVLESLALDAASIDSTSDFDDWAREFGYEFDAECARMTKRKAEEYGYDCEKYHTAKAAYAATKTQKAKLEAFLGDLYEDLLTNTDPE